MVTKYTRPPINFGRGFLDKLRRERTRFKRGGPHKADAEYNFYVTAWHLTDWTWKERIEGDTALQQRIGLPTGAKLEDFQRWVRGKGGDPMVRCYKVATGAKHYELDHPGAEPLVDVSAGERMTKSGIVFWIVEHIDKTTGMPIGEFDVDQEMAAILKFWAESFSSYLS